MITELMGEVRNFGLFLEAIGICAFYTGLVFVPLVLVGYESWKRRAL